MEVAEAQTGLAVAEGQPNALQGLTRLPVFKQVLLMLALAASVALGVGVVFWSQAPNYSVLYGKLSGKEASEIMEVLGQVGIKVKLDTDSGAVLVRREQLHDARMKLATEGLPKSTEMGFEVLKEQQGFGTSQSLERARFKRALEVELARTIGSLNNVESARVHLAIPKQSVFVRNRKSPSASVLLDMYAGRQLEPEQVAAIAHLVAAAVSNMEPGQVKIVGEKGRLLSDPDQLNELMMSKKQLEYAREMEASYVKRIRAILTPLVGEQGVRAQVNAAIDFTVSEQTRESFDPDLPALRSEQTLEEENASGGARGVPGALSNQPPGAANVPERAGEAGGGAGAVQGSNRRRATRNFELDRTVSHTRLPSAVLRRLSVAVLVDDHRSLADDGSVVHQALTPEEIDRITRLVKETIGFNPERGDSVNVTNARFLEPEALESLPDVPLWEQPWVWDIGRQVLGALFVLLMVFAVFRPAMRNLVGHEQLARDKQAALLEQQAGEAPESEGGKAQASLDKGQSEGPLSEEEIRQLGGPADYEGKVKAIKNLVTEDPKRVAQVVKAWVKDDQGAGER